MRELTPMEERLFNGWQLPCDDCRREPAAAVHENAALCPDCAGRLRPLDYDPREMGFAAEARAEVMGWTD